MSAEKKAYVCQLANAERDARAHPHVDINSPVELCQASQPEIFVVPVRYALAEEWASHPCCDPGVVPQSHAMAARRLRCGYLYLWHQEGWNRHFTTRLAVWPMAPLSAWRWINTTTPG